MTQQPAEEIPAAHIAAGWRRHPAGIEDTIASSLMRAQFVVEAHIRGVRTAELFKARKVPEVVVTLGFHVPDLVLAGLIDGFSSEGRA